MIGIVAASVWELSGLKRRIEQGKPEWGEGLRFLSGILAGTEVVLVASGIGQEQAAYAARLLLQRFRPSLLLSIGFAGALRPELQSADLILGERIIGTRGKGELQEALLLSPVLLTQAEQAARTSGLRWWRGTLLCSDRMLIEPKEKSEAAESEALAVEMESWAIAQIASKAGVPFLAVKTISDSLDQSLGLDFNRLLDKNGYPAYGRILLAILTHPGALPSLCRLQRTNTLAKRSLTTFLARFLGQLVQPTSILHNEARSEPDSAQDPRRIP